MNMIEVKDYRGNTIAKMPSEDIHVSSAVVSSAFMANDTLTIGCSSLSGIEFPVGCWVELDDGNIYRMNQLPQKSRSGANAGYEYTLVFESAKYDLVNVRFLLPDEAVGDVMTADLRTLVQLVVDNANRVYGAGMWIVGSVPETPVISQQFTQFNCLGALQSMMTAWEKDHDKVYEFRVVRESGVNKVNVMEEDGGEDANLMLAYGHVGGLYSIQRNAVVGENIVTRLYAYGSTENIHVGYRYTRLCMPGTSRNESFVEDQYAEALYGIKEGYATYDDVKPRALFSVDEVYRIENPASRSGYNIKIKSKGIEDLGFCPEATWTDSEDDYQEWLAMYGYNEELYTRSYFSGAVGGAATKVVGTKKYAANGTMTVTFNTGKCAGIAFEVVEGSASNVDGYMTLITQNYNENVPGEYHIPSDSEGSTWEIQVGDEFVISNILLPMALVEKAERELADRAKEDLATGIKKNARYSVEFDQIAKDEMDLSGLIPGNFVHVKDDALGIDENTSIKVNKVDRDLLSGDISAEISSIKLRKRGSGRERGNESIRESRTEQTSERPTTLTCQFIPNYDYRSQGSTLEPYNTLYVGAGAFTNSSLMGEEKVWDISERVVNLQSGFKYDIYVQASRRTNYATICVRKNRYAEMQSIIDNIPGVVTDNPLRNTKTNIVGSIDDGSFYFKIGTISEERLVLRMSDWRGDAEGASPTRTLTLQYGVAVMSANDITSGTLGGSVVIGNKTSIFDKNGVSINVRGRLEADRDNVALLNESLSGLKNSLHDVITTMRTASADIKGKVSFLWTKCDYDSPEGKCEEVKDPEDLVPKIDKLT